MDPERWQKLDGIFHASLEREPSERNAFIAEACDGDLELQQELQSMLDHFSKASGFIEQPAYALAADAMAQDDSDSLIGKLFGPYQIERLLGSGGMGLVYLAIDQELGRKVALKFLHLHLTEDKGRVGRFKQEARAASALNHPNILTVHQIGILEGRHFIATEFVEGETLREVMNRSPLDLRSVIDIAAQVASGLAAAHVEGIVHRDIKPENIMVRPDGYVKVLDYGIAKLTDTSRSDSALMTLINTEEGTIVGTVRYMSPEQVRGQVVDSRSDIWSLGVVLYEMVAKRSPFEGETRSDVIAAILEREPLPLTHFEENVPLDLELLVTRALEKDRQNRYQTAGELMTNLQKLKLQAELGFGSGRLAHGKIDTASAEKENRNEDEGQIGANKSTSSATYLVRKTQRYKVAVSLGLVALVIAVAAIGFGWNKLSKRNQTQRYFQTITMTRLTTSARIRGATISPDGKYVAYVRDDAGTRSIWLRQVGTTSDLQVASETDAAALAFSPDGTHLYWTNFFGELFRMPVLGGSKSSLLKDVDSFALSPDGSRLAFTRHDHPNKGDSSLLLANNDGNGERNLALRKQPDPFNGGLAWSPIGDVILSGAGSTDSSVVEVEVDSGDQRTVTSRRWADVRGLAWLPDGGSILMLASEKGSFSAQLWQLDSQSGEARRITNDFVDYSGLSLTANSRMLVSVQEGRAAHLVVINDVGLGNGKQISSRAGNYFGISSTPDGKLVFASDASGTWDIWLVDPKGGDPKQLTVNASGNLLPSVSPDGRYIVFTSTRSGSPNIWKMDLDGGNPKQLTNGTGEYSADWSPDGKWVVYVREDAGLQAIWKVPADGGTPVKLADNPAADPVFSPDGKLIACSYGNGKVALIPAEGGTPIKVFDIPTPFIIEPGFQWTRDGNALTYVETRDQVSNLWSQPVAGGPAKKLTNFTSEEIFSFAWTGNGKQLAIARGVETGDVVLIRDGRQ